MTTSVKTSQKMLIFDGDCPMCNATVGWLLAAGWVMPEQTRANYDLAPGELELARAAGIKNQLVVFDPLTRETRAGSDGLLWIIGANRPWNLLVRVLALPGFRHGLRIAYETISYNRRVISPPRHQIVCDCEPDVTPARRLMLIVPLAVVALILVGLLGAAMSFGWELGSAWQGAALAIVAAASGPVVLAVAAAVSLSGQQRIDYVAHLVVTFFAGAVLVSPAIVASLAPSPSFGLVFDLLAVAAAAYAMFRMQRRRLAVLKLPPAWLWAWLALVPLPPLAAILWVAFGGGLAA